MIPAIPPDKYLTPITNKRRITTRSFNDCVSKNVIEQYKINNDRPFKIPTNNGSEQYKNSFFVKTIPEWNGLASHIVSAKSLDIFKERLTKEN